jgi:hypothetical protein
MTTLARDTGILALLSSIVMASGCASTGTREIAAEKPGTNVWISSFQLADGRVIVHAAGTRPTLRDSGGHEATAVTVQVGESFTAAGFNCSERWKLNTVAPDSATFDVRGRYYGCTDPFAVFLSIPSRTSHWTVIVRTDFDPKRPRPQWF